MSFKLLLAEALEVLKEASRDEAQCDALQTKYAENSKYRDQLPNLRRQYAAVFNTRIRGLEMINHVRMSSDDVSLKKFCSDTMVAGMDACERVRDKETSILLPAGLVQGTFAVESMMVVGEKGQRKAVDKVYQTGARDDGVLITKDGYLRLGEPLFAIGHDGKETLAGSSQPLRQEWTLSSGAYQLAIINNDKYAVAAPVIDAVIQSESPSTGQKMLYRKRLPAGCAWARFIGVVNKSTLKLIVSSDAWMRHSQIRVELSRITCFKDAQGNPICEEAAAAAALDFNNNTNTSGAFSRGGGGGFPSASSGPTSSTGFPSSPSAAAAGGAKKGSDYDYNMDMANEAMPSWLANTNVPTGYVGESAPMEMLLAPTSVVGPSSRADSDDMLGARAIAGGEFAQHAAPASASSAQSRPADAFAMANPNYAGPKVEISPLNCTPEQRLLKIKNASWQWYDDAPHGFGAANYNQTESEANKELLKALLGLVEPTPLGEEGDC